MEEIQLTTLQKNIYDVIDSVIRSHRSVLIRDKGKTLVKITPATPYEQKSWLGCMRGKGRVKGDIISPAEDSENWKVLWNK
jgi:antitoxin (DNA-binding transcriptional repressor) of toxin-antitoxin stability system